jgi:Fic family protein
MVWNWEQADWPNFTFKSNDLVGYEQQFLLRSGEFIGAYKHIGLDDQNSLKIELISDEALKTSEIEGEVLNRESVQSSLRKQFGLGGDERKIPPAERGIAEMMVNLYDSFAAPLTHETMFEWHKMLMSGERRSAVGGYRTHQDPMQVVSGKLHDREVYFEAPPSSRMKSEMDAFVAWFNETGPDSARAPRANARRHCASLLRLYSSVRGWQRPDCARARGEIARAEPRPSELDCARLYH